MVAPRQLFEDFLALFYPRLCLACGQHPPTGDDLTCTVCQYQLPQTNFHLERENGFTEHFWGRLPLQAGAARYYFTKKSKTQQLIHQLKYGGQARVGLQVGRQYGRELRDAPHFRGIDLIVPVPLHPRKQKMRGYNQSDSFARGLSESLQRPWQAHALQRVSPSPSQTQKTRIERFENVRRAFRVPRPANLRGKHLLLVDDVLTTGATLEACALQILAIPGTTVSMATIAMAQQS
ncbi:MAG: ComF family protein [Bacteroidota bacterium]